jgi:hypothetical protein
LESAARSADFTLRSIPEGQAIKRVIVVPGKLVNLILG